MGATEIVVAQAKVHGCLLGTVHGCLLGTVHGCLLEWCAWHLLEWMSARFSPQRAQ